MTARRADDGRGYRLDRLRRRLVRAYGLASYRGDLDRMGVLLPRIDACTTALRHLYA